MRTALLLIAHGSRQTEANEDLFYVLAEMRRRGEFEFVQAAFLELAEPTILEGGARCVQAGAQKIVMLPYFLSAGIHVRRDLTDFQKALTARFPAVDFRLAEPLGRHPQLLEVVAARAREALGIADDLMSL